MLERKRAMFVGEVYRSGDDWLVEPDGRELTGPIIVRDAEARSRDIIDSGRQEAVRKARELVEKYRADAERERRRQIDAVKDVSGELLTSKADRIEGAVRKVLEIVKGT